MQVEVGQQRADDPALGTARFRVDLLAVFLETAGGLNVSARVQNVGRSLSAVAREGDEMCL